ncbi:gp53-like domain-containing protein [Escherichia coli]
MMPSARYFCIFINVGLGEAAKRNVGTGSGQIPDMSSFSGSIASKGYQKLPGGLIIQWGAGDAGTGYVGLTGNEMNFPIAFPSQCFQVVTSYDNGGGKIVAGAAGNMTRTGFLLRCDASGGNYNFRWFAIGC